jgi:hypothetical protein
MSRLLLLPLAILLAALAGCGRNPAPSPRAAAPSSKKPASPAVKNVLTAKAYTREQTAGVLGAGLLGAASPLHQASYAVVNYDNTGLNNLWPVRHGEMLTEPVAPRFDRRRAAAILGSGLLGAGAGGVWPLAGYAAFTEDAADLLELKGTTHRRSARRHLHRRHPFVVHVPYTTHYTTSTARPGGRAAKTPSTPKTAPPKSAKPTVRPPRPRR